MILADLPQYKNENLVSSNYLLPIVRFVSEQVKRILGSLTGMRNICFLLVPDFDQHLKIEFLKLCLYLCHSQGDVLMDGKMGLMKDLVVFGQRFVLSEDILYHQYIICFRQTKAHQALLHVSVSATSIKIYVGAISSDQVPVK